MEKYQSKLAIGMLKGYKVVNKLLIENVELVDKLFKFVTVAYCVKSGLFVIAF